jgi:hypothetical protein
MERDYTFGIIGGYGATGSAVATALLKSGDGQILVGGRDLNKTKQLTARNGGRTTAAKVDVLDARSLHEFRNRCSIIINCAGPVMLLQDRVAQAALRSQSHYIDVAGMTVVKEGMLPNGGRIADLGLSFVVSAGWMPGLSELVPSYANLIARSKMDAIESVSVYFSDSGEWSDNAFRDGAWFIHRVGLPRPMYFQRGKQTRVKMSAASRIVDLGEPIGRGRFSLVSLPELDEIGKQLTDCDFFSYSYLSGWRTAAAVMLIALVPLPERTGIRLFRKMFRRNRFPVDGFALAKVIGKAQRREAVFTARVVYRDRRDYWMNGIVPATVARWISQQQGVKAGLHYLADAVDPVPFIMELKQAGVEQSEEFQISD